MKSVKLELPARLHRSLKQWLLDCDETQADMFCYLVDNLPPVPKLKPNSELKTYLGNLANQSFIKSQYGSDKKRILELIAKGIVKPSVEEQKLIDKLLGPSK